MSDWLKNGDAGVAQSDRPIVKGDFKVYTRLPSFAVGQVDKQTSEDFFILLNMGLNDSSMTLMADSRLEAEMLSQLKTIGIGPGLDFSWASLSAETKAALDTGFKAGFDQVRQALKTGLVDMNGWQALRNSGRFQTDWLDRAVMADAGWAGPDKNISHAAAFRFTDADNSPLNGSNTYTLTFDMNNLPPVTVFWSIPIYNADGYFVANEIDRYTINSFMLKRNELTVTDGKLVIYVQHNKPEDPAKQKNWLPAPPAGFRFTARFYGPYQALVDGSYKMPAPVKTGIAH